MTAGLDPHVVAPARLTLMTALTAVSEVEFSILRARLEVSDSVLSKHLTALEDVGYIKRRKGVHRGRRSTWIPLISARSAATCALSAARPRGASEIHVLRRPRGSR